MSLLTKEQKLTTDHIRAKLREDEGWGGRGGYESELLAIIDDLQARAHIIDCEFCDGTGGFQNEQTGEITDCRRCKGSGKHVLAPRQYTEQELREAFEREIDKESGYASPMHFHCDLDIWMQCARFLGALKAEP